MDTRVRTPKKEDIETYIHKNPEDFHTFPEKIKCARINYRGNKKSVGLTITKAAKQMQMSTVHLSQLENGKRRVPGVLILGKLTKFYKFKTGELEKSLEEAIK